MDTPASDPNQELRLHPGWWARLEGEALDLDALGRAFDDSSSVQFRQFGGRAYMMIADFDQLDDSNAVETRAAEMLRIINGAARVEHGDSREVRVDAAARVAPDGQIQHFIHVCASIHARARVSVTASVNGELVRAVRQPTITARALEGALGDPQAERALRIFGRDDADYRDLYHVFEIAEAALASDMYSDGTVTRSDARLFKHTANSVHALGDQARHGSEATQPPPVPMSFADAQALVGRVLRIWFTNTPRI